jgi:hypothetical protein
MKKIFFVTFLIPLLLLTSSSAEAKTIETEVITEQELLKIPLSPGFVSPDDAWGMFFLDGANNPYDFIESNPSIGDGSLYILPFEEPATVGTNDKFVGTLFLNQQISELNEFSYDFKIGQGGTAVNAPKFYARIYTAFGESPTNTFYDCRYELAPTTGSTSSYTTISFDPTNTYSVTTRGTSPYPCPDSPVDMDLIEPGSFITQIGFQLDTDTGDDGLDGYFDNFILDTTTKKTIYDFELNFPEPSTSNQSGQSGRRVRLVCNDPHASNFANTRFGRHTPSLCRYDTRVVEQQNCSESFTETLQRGDRDGQPAGYNNGNTFITQVAQLQSFINILLEPLFGPQASGPIDGIFGPSTQLGVQRLQYHLNQLFPDTTLSLDGIVGPNTREVMNRICL